VLAWIRRRDGPDRRGGNSVEQRPTACSLAISSMWTRSSSSACTYYSSWR